MHVQQPVSNRPIISVSRLKGGPGMYRPHRGRRQLLARVVACSDHPQIALTSFNSLTTKRLHPKPHTGVPEPSKVPWRPRCLLCQSYARSCLSLPPWSAVHGLLLCILSRRQGCAVQIRQLGLAAQRDYATPLISPHDGGGSASLPLLSSWSDGKQRGQGNI